MINKKSDNTAQLSTLFALGVTTFLDDIYIYTKDSATIHVYREANKHSFKKEEQAVVIHDLQGKAIPAEDVNALSLSSLKGLKILTYLHKNHLSWAVSHDIYMWKTIAENPEMQHNGVLVSDYLYRDSNVLYTGGESIRVAYSSTLETWDFQQTEIKPHTEKATIIVLGAFLTTDGIVVLAARRVQDSFYLDACLFDKVDPAKLLWQLDGFWQMPHEMIQSNPTPLGAVYTKGEIVSYWYSHDKGIFPIEHSLFSNVAKDQHNISFSVLNKYHNNPILTPNKANIWESQATFNPTALRDEGKTHLVYRAVGQRYLSVLGYATSKDGYTIDERFDEPMYVPRESFEGAVGEPLSKSNYISGPSWGGCEDPRLTKIDNTIYMTYVAFNGWNPPRVALTSIQVEDFRARNWNKWTKPSLISKPGVVDKNAALLPEKINNKFVMFHRIFPNILIDFVDTLDFDGETKFLKGEYKIAPTKNGWDSRKVGTGPSPIRTKEGWLLIYHAVDDKADHEYKMGAMLLDINDPTKVLLRSTRPILEPREWYENIGHKSGVPYPCGATLVDDTLFVYYGGADSVVCVATANINDFLDRLHHSSRPRLHTMNFIQ